MALPVCTIVGVGPGIGMAVARRFAKEGFQLALLARNPESLATYAAELQTQGATVHTYPADAADFASLTAAFTALHQQQGNTQVLVSNAAVWRQVVPSKLEADTLVQDFRTNVAGALQATQQVLPNMLAQSKGTVLFTGGGSALDPLPNIASLSVGKAGIRNLAFSLAAELSPAGIHVATVTVRGMVKPGTRFDPDVIAETYWRLHQQAPGAFDREIIYQ